MLHKKLHRKPGVGKKMSWGLTIKTGTVLLQVEEGEQTHAA